MNRKIKQLERSLRQLHSISERRFTYGDYGACDILMDLERDIKYAKLTERQADCLYMRYVDDLDTSEIAKQFDISVRAVNLHLEASLKKIAGVVS